LPKFLVTFAKRIEVIMGANFRIDVTRQNRSILFKLHGDLNGSSACEVLRRMENYKGSALIILDFSRIRKCHPFGIDILKKGIRKEVIIKGFRS